MASSISPLALHRAGNNFGFLRVVFALLVIVSHSPVLIDGNNSRELWNQIFGPTFSLGGLGVDGFFLISGYLITKSFQSSKTIGAYLFKRVLRIYPGFLVAYAISFVFVGWLAGGKLSAMTWIAWLKQFIYMLLLNGPRELDGVFAQLPFPALNGSMWTIGLEFQCYLLVIVAGVCGLLQKRWIYLAITLCLVPIALSHSFNLHVPLPYKDVIPYYYAPTTTLNDSLRFMAIFLCGGAFYLFRDEIVYTDRGAFFAAAMLVPMLFNYHLVEPGLAILGGYLLFWFSFRKVKALNGIGRKVDLSYGIYLYAWPIQSLLILYIADISPWTVTIIASAISAAFAYVSWTLVEYPCLLLKGERRIGTRNATAAT